MVFRKSDYFYVFSETINWRCSSVGQSMRLISAVSGVQIPASPPPHNPVSSDTVHKGPRNRAFSFFSCPWFYRILWSCIFRRLWIEIWSRKRFGKIFRCAVRNRASIQAIGMIMQRAWIRALFFETRFCPLGFFYCCSEAMATEPCCWVRWLRNII